MTLVLVLIFVVVFIGILCMITEDHPAVRGNPLFLVACSYEIVCLALFVGLHAFL